MGINADTGSSTFESTDHRTYYLADREKLIMYATDRQRSSAVLLKVQMVVKHIHEVILAMV